MYFIFCLIYNITNLKYGIEVFEVSLKQTKEVKESSLKETYAIKETFIYNFGKTEIYPIFIHRPFVFIFHNPTQSYHLRIFLLIELVDFIEVEC